MQFQHDTLNFLFFAVIDTNDFIQLECDIIDSKEIIELNISWNINVSLTLINEIEVYLDNSSNIPNSSNISPNDNLTVPVERCREYNITVVVYPKCGENVNNTILKHIPRYKGKQSAFSKLF